MQFAKNTGKISEDKLKQERTGTRYEKDLDNRKRRTKAWERQIEASTYWRERDHCGWTGSLTKPRRPQTNTSYITNTPDIHKDGSNTTGLIQIIRRDFCLKCFSTSNTPVA